MHVGLNLVFLVPGETGGMETYARELIAALIEHAPELRLTIFLSREAATDTTAPWAAAPSVTVAVNARRRTEWVRGEQQLLPRIARDRGVDLLHSLASTGPIRGRFHKVVTIHDLIYRIYPEAHAGIKSKGMGVLVPLAARRSDRVITPSSTTRDDVVRLLKVPEERVDVVHEGVRRPTIDPSESPGQLRARLNLGTRPLVLTLSAKRPHKNLERLLEAIKLIPAERRPLLLLPGYRTPWESALRHHAIDLGIDGDVRFLGWVPTSELEALFAAADCFVFPSLYEGFGLPVLEAMARGVPVACSDRGALREVAGDAARLFDPENPAAIAEAVAELLADRSESERLAKAGRVRAEAFTWERTARATLAAYARTLDRSRDEGRTGIVYPDTDP
jgi:glycosyltransferase involved in cell wall biosynthesis